MMKTKIQEGLKRPKIPAFKIQNVRISEEGQLLRSWSVVQNDFFRIYCDEPLVLEVEFRNAVNQPKVFLYTNILAAEGQWEELGFSHVQGMRFAITLMPSRTGIFLFKLKYSFDDGVHWFMDRTSFTKVIVDPCNSRNIRLYTLIPTASGHIGNWKEELLRIRDMGFTMVHLLPITRMGKSESPYAAADLFDIDPSYLDPSDSRPGLDQFEDFVRFAKSEGIALCLDLVLNHVGIDSEMVKRSPEWIVPDKNEPDGLLRAGCWHMNSWIKWTDLARINYDVPEQQMKEELWQYMEDYVFFWSYYADYTGGMIRLDNLHSSHQQFMASMLGKLRKSFPKLVVQAEFFSDSNTLLKAVSESDLNLLLANPWEYPFAENLRVYLKYIHEISRKLRFLTPVSTHDTGSPAQIYGSPDAVVPRYFVTALMSTGQTGFVQGAEHGVLKKVEFIGRNLKVESTTPEKYSPMIKLINRIQSDYPAFEQGNNIQFIDKGHGALIVALREDHDSGEDRFILCANLDTHGTHTISLDCSAWKKHGLILVLRDLIHQTIKPVKSDFFEMSIEPCGIRAFRMEYADE